MLSTLREVALSAAPILKRELLGLLRTRKAFRITAATVLGTGFIPLLGWPESGSALPHQHAREAFETYRWTFLVALYLFVPAVAAASYTTEREQGTYDLLVSTPLRPAGVAIGKLLSSVALFLLVLVSTFPVVTVLYLLGGFTPGELLAQLAAFLFCACVSGALGVLASAKSARTWHAVLKAYWFCAAAAPAFLVSISPSVLLSAKHLAVAICLGAGLLGGFVPHLAVRMLRPSRRSPRDPDRPRTERLPAPFIKAGEPLSYRTWLGKRLFPSMEKGIPEWRNPILVDSVKREYTGSRSFPTALFAGFAFSVPVFVLVAASIGAARALTIALTFMLALMCLTLPSLAALLVFREREPERMDLLRSTLLRPREILEGKLGASIFSGGRFILYGGLYCALFLPLLLFDPRSLGIPIYFLLASGPVALFAAAAGLAGATASSTSLEALVRANLASAVYFLGLPLVGGFEDPVARCVNPVVGFVGVAWPLGSNSGGVMGFLASCGIPVLIASTLFSSSVTRFEKRWMRDR